MTRHPFALIVTLSGLGLCAGPASPGSSPARHPCASVIDNAARLACYDEAFGPPASPAASAAAASVTTSAGVPGEVKARQEFGLSEHARQALAGKQPGIVAEPKSLQTTVASVRRRPTGEMIVTLDDGQVWVELEANSGAALKSGDAVTIRKASLGSYMLVTPQHVATRVRRVK